MTTGPVRIESIEALAALRSEWEALLGASAQPSVFLTPAWVLTWWPRFGKGHELCAIAVRDTDGTLIGLAPLYARAGVEGYPPHMRALLCIGQEGDTLAEELGVIAKAGAEAQVAQAVATAVHEMLASTADVLHLARVREDDPVLPHLESALADVGATARRDGAQPSPYLTLPADPDALLASRSKNFRKQLREAGNRLGREGEVDVVLAGSDMELDEAMDVLVALHRTRWGPDDGSFDTDAYVDFHRAFSRELLAQDRLLLALLRVDGKPVAARYDFLYAGRVWCFQGGWDPALERMRVGTLLTRHVMEQGIARGAGEYAFLSGDDPYKRRWADGERTLIDLTAWRDTPATRRWLRRERWKARLRAFPPARWLARRLRKSS